ncbi:MAG TPA: isoprenylcysteine carboxylmethyltransferase family protein [Micropepsaceae bacterium]|nr:isoprenylcysteine carboxylmethyltransferase family protein [Micropepsaceae bacterium]
MILLYQRIAGGLWLLFCLVWLIGSLRAKKTASRRALWTQMPWRVGIAVVLVALLVSRWGHELLRPGAATLASPTVGLIGLVLCILGLAYAVWARIVIGTNWGMPMSLKENPQLVTSGPYAQVRHPIYSGVLLAMLGSGLAISLWWFIFFAVNAGQFLYAARKEEQLMLQTFPDSYPGYMRRTRMLIPFVF